jgi:hypothetical protein
MTLTRATLGKLQQRATKDMEIHGHKIRIQRPTPLEFSEYQMSLVEKDGKWNANNLDKALRLLMCRMWIDEAGNRIFSDSETKELGEIDLLFYKKLQDACQQFAHNSEAPQVLGESVETIASDSPAEYALSSE